MQKDPFWLFWIFKTLLWTWENESKNADIIEFIFKTLEVEEKYKIRTMDFDTNEIIYLSQTKDIRILLS